MMEMMAHMRTSPARADAHAVNRGDARAAFRPLSVGGGAIASPVVVKGLSLVPPVAISSPTSEHWGAKQTKSGGVRARRVGGVEVLGLAEGTGLSWPVSGVGVERPLVGVGVPVAVGGGGISKPKPGGWGLVHCCSLGCEGGRVGTRGSTCRNAIDGRTGAQLHQ